jgi:hypothetical protein
MINDDVLHEGGVIPDDLEGIIVAVIRDAGHAGPDAQVPDYDIMGVKGDPTSFQ